MSKKCVIYARVSSREQKEHGYSTEAQIALLKEYAKRNNFEIVEIYEDVETAKKAGRKNFNIMLKFLKKNKTVKTILVEKTDRLYRNFKDYVTIDELDGLEVHLVKENTVLSENSRSHEKFVHGIKVLMAKNYIDNLSEEVKKGMHQKASQGEYPAKPPYGYYRENSKTIKINPKTAPFVLRAYNLYAEGNLSLAGVCERLYDEGFRYTESSPKIYTSLLEKILKNPFYLGNFVFRGQHYTGKHEPLIDIETFEKVQKAFKKDSKPDMYRQHQFLFAGMFKCEACGSAITGEIKKGKYIYYRCGNKDHNCPNKSIYVKEQELMEQMGDIVKNITITAEHQDAIIRALKESHIEEQRYHKEQVKYFQTACEKLKNRISNLYTDKLDGLIDNDLYKIKNEEWTMEFARMKSLMDSHEKANTNYMNEGIKILELAKNLYPQYLRQNDFEKVKMIKIVSSNFSLNARKAHYAYKKPFDILAKGLNYQIDLGRKDSNLRMPGPKPGALPLGDAPIAATFIILTAKIQLSIFYLYKWTFFFSKYYFNTA